MRLEEYQLLQHVLLTTYLPVCADFGIKVDIDVTISLLIWLYCAETGVPLVWLANSKGNKFDGKQLKSCT